MKKRLEAELISIAHRVLKLKNKSEIDQLYLETRKLYEALAVLKFYGDNYEQLKAKISKDDIEEKVAHLLEEKTPDVVAIKSEPSVEVVVAAETPEDIVAEEKGEEKMEEALVAEEETAETLVEEPVIVGEIVVDDEEESITQTEGISEASTDEPEPEVPIIDFAPIFELSSEEEEIEAVAPVLEEKKSEPRQISFEELLGESYTEPVFVKPSELDNKFAENKPILNDLLSKGINISLNDRVAFIHNLFDGSGEDFNRVLSQLNTANSMAEVHAFINENVKPDYNNWNGKEEYVERLLELVEKKFS